MKIIALAENVSNDPHLAAQHGLSLYIEAEGKKILFDTGASDIFLKNASALGIDVKMIDMVIISHNHSDHIGGIDEFLAINKKAVIYIRHEAQSQFIFKFWLFRKNIGEHAGLFEQYRDRIIFISQPELKIGRGMYLLANSVFDLEFHSNDRTLFEYKNKRLARDEFKHEHSLVICENKTLNIITGCSHSGIINIIETVRQRFPDQAIDNVVGGFHMMGLMGGKTMNCSRASIKNVARKLNDQGVLNIYPCHCTGTKAFRTIQQNFNGHAKYFETGSMLKTEGE